ncbi:MAG: hypothetical protein EON58_02545 [Alphaproteobacteria bacterium]|nr:MAG: hypothetical protein EON58_02545 [Alphaproteobacteria bacterium]
MRASTSAPVDRRVLREIHVPGPNGPGTQWVQGSGFRVLAMDDPGGFRPRNEGPSPEPAFLPYNPTEMPVVNYHVANGRLRGQTTSGVRTDYLTDALGSVTATVTATATVENTYRYKPYGDRLSKTGTGVDPRFLWTGDTGSRTTGAAKVEQYNRARHYGNRSGMWTSLDPLWPVEKAYAYVRGNPTTWTDPSGLKVDTPFGGCGSYKLGDQCAKIRKALKDKDIRRRMLKCLKAEDARGSLEKLIQYIEDACGSSGPRVCVLCGTGTPKDWPKGPCGGPCEENGTTGTGKTTISEVIPIITHKDIRIDGYSQSFTCRSGYDNDCYGALVSKFPKVEGCDCILSICRGTSYANENRFYVYLATLAHELTHCSGFRHEINGFQDLAYRIGCCACKATESATKGDVSKCVDVCSGSWSGGTF